MRALCGAIITAGSLIGLGFTAMGIGTRYDHYAPPADSPPYVRFGQVDSALLFILFFLIFMTIVGMAIAFIGLAYHHHRRHHEFLRHHAGTPPTTPPHVTV